MGSKLIDFGAMTPMGPSKELVGTPAFCAPEILNMQALDARTDLYALGATLYFALTGRHAYPARDFASLSNAWRFGIARPSELVPGIPDCFLGHAAERSVAEIVPMAERFPAFQVVVAYGEAEYQRIRGDCASALRGLSELLKRCQAGSHQIWPQLTAAHICTLDGLGDATSAAERGRAYLDEATRAQQTARARCIGSHWRCV
jgi:serine/threonine protein kinase